MAFSHAEGYQGKRQPGLSRKKEPAAFRDFARLFATLPRISSRAHRSPCLPRRFHMQAASGSAAHPRLENDRISERGTQPWASIRRASSAFAGSDLFPRSIAAAHIDKALRIDTVQLREQHDGQAGGRLSPGRRIGERDSRSRPVCEHHPTGLVCHVGDEIVHPNGYSSGLQSPQRARCDTSVVFGVLENWSQTRPQSGSRRSSPHLPRLSAKRPETPASAP